jgi:hypothetical protein
MSSLGDDCLGFVTERLVEFAALCNNLLLIKWLVPLVLNKNKSFSKQSYHFNVSFNMLLCTIFFS